MKRWRNRLWRATLLVMAWAAVTRAAAAALPPDTMPLSEVKPGMKGEWRTVVSGTTVQSYQLEVVGVMQNFTGPRRSIIICEALDPEQMENGPVAGMSGSPVYIDGKLVGAYAYGFPFSKNQALIGVTPIQDMMEVLDAPAATPLPGRPGPPRFADAGGTSADAGESSIAEAPVAASAGVGEWHLTEGSERLGNADALESLRPLPTPLLASGISARTLAVFKDEFAKRGLEVMQAPGGAVAGGGPDADQLEAGSAIGVMLMTGDFTMSGVGTLTWRDGDRLLAFGHPMFGFGPVDMPLATASVVTVVRALDQSFKLANTGPVVGTISQDRLTGIGGTLAQKPPMTAFHAQVTAPDGKTREFQGEMWQNRDYTPVIGAMALMESLGSTLQAQQEQTFFVTTTLDIDGYPPVKLEQVGSGLDGATEVAMGFMQLYDTLLNNPFEFPHVRSVNFDIRLRDAWLTSTLEGIRVESGPARAGGTLRVTLTISNYLNVPTEHTLEIPIPDTAAGETLTLFLGDASATDALERGQDRGDFTSLADVVNNLRQQHSRGALYVKLLRAAPGLHVDGADLPALPPSIEALYRSPKNVTPSSPMDQTAIWETSIPMPGEYNGRFTLPVEVKP
ncbi:MAG: SpoIVB peptidase S55 domain-containing protein [Opitutales bacterium]